MKKYILIFSIFILLNKDIIAQRKANFSNDSILKMFQSMTPFQVLEKFIFIYNIDYKNLYNDVRLKPYFMKWLDNATCIQYEIANYKLSIENDPKIIKREILYHLIKQKKKKYLDTITNDLYSRYKDSIIFLMVDEFSKQSAMVKNPIPEMAISFHSHLAYPESYKIIKNWWIEAKKDTSYSLFFPLLRMEDPEAQRIFDKIVQKCIDSNGENSDLMWIRSVITYLRNSYAISKSLELLSVNKKFQIFSDDVIRTPFNYEILNFVKELIFYNFIEIDKSVNRMDFDEKLFKNKDKILPSANLLMKKLDQDNLYWKKNIQYY